MKGCYIILEIIMAKSFLRAINSRYYPLYANIDEGSGRLRMGLTTLQKFCPQARINSVVKLRISISNELSIIVLCTIWPDSEYSLADDCICLDDTVQLGNDWCGIWVEGCAEVWKLK